jgi:ERCC4-type nuclease
VDIREPQELVDYFVSHKSATVEKLPTGDYVYQDMVGFERKSKDFFDFTRMFSEVDELIEVYPFPFLILDLPLTTLVKEANKVFHTNKLPEILGAIASLSVRGCPPIFCDNQAMMVIVMEKIATKCLDGKDRSSKRFLRTRHLDHEDSAVNILRAMNVGLKKAEDISTFFAHDIRKIVKLALDDPEKFAEVPGVSQGTIDKINSALDNKLKTIEVSLDDDKGSAGEENKDPF